MSVPSSPSVRPESHTSGQTPGQTLVLSDIDRHILQTLHNIRFGTLEIVIHDSRVVQIERSEKTRFDVKGKPLSESLS